METGRRQVDTDTKENGWNEDKKERQKMNIEIIKTEGFKLRSRSRVKTKLFKRKERRN